MVDYRKDSFIEKSINLYGDKYNYNKVEYHNSKKHVTITCSLHGDFLKTPNNHLRGQGCPKCANEKKSLFNSSNKEEFINKAKKIHGNKYDYKEVDYRSCKEYVIINCPLHGNFNQRPNNHLNGSGCKKCGHEVTTSDTNKFIEKAIKIHGNLFGYKKVIYNGALNKVIITCPIHGDFLQSPNDHLKGSGCPACSESKGEKYIANILKNKNIKFFREKTFEDCKGKSRRLFFDFYIPDYDVLIEYDGQQHFEPLDFFKGDKRFEEIKSYDQIKNEYAIKNNIKLIRIKYSTPFEDIEGIILTEMNVELNKKGVGG